MIKKKSFGFSVVEVLVALGIVGVTVSGFIGLYSALNQQVRIARKSQELNYFMVKIRRFLSERMNCINTFGQLGLNPPPGVVNALGRFIRDRDGNIAYQLGGIYENGIRIAVFQESNFTTLPAIAPGPPFYSFFDLRVELDTPNENAFILPSLRRIETMRFIRRTVPAGAPLVVSVPSDWEQCFRFSDNGIDGLYVNINLADDPGEIVRHDPTEKIWVDGYVEVLKTGVTGGIVQAERFLQPSDEKLKSNWSPIENPLAKISSIGVYSYKLNNDPSNKTHTGVLAQELENISPLVISKGDLEKTKAVKYTQLIPLEIEGVKALYDLQINLKNDIKENQKKIEALKK